jgi:hypothetical protein
LSIYFVPCTILGNEEIVVKEKKKDNNFSLADMTLWKGGAGRCQIQSHCPISSLFLAS